MLKKFVPQRHRCRVLECALFCARKTAQPSVLRLPSDRLKSLDQLKSLEEFRWGDILICIQMKERAPDVFDFMVAMAVSMVKGNDGRQIIPLATAYSIPYLLE